MSPEAYLTFGFGACPRSFRHSVGVIGVCNRQHGVDVAYVAEELDNHEACAFHLQQATPSQCVHSLVLSYSLLQDACARTTTKRVRRLVPGSFLT